MAGPGELAIVGLIATHRLLPLQRSQEQAQEVLYGLGKGRDGFRDLSMERDGPCHRDTIPTKGIVSSRTPELNKPATAQHICCLTSPKSAELPPASGREPQAPQNQFSPSYHSENYQILRAAEGAAAVESASGGWSLQPTVCLYPAVCVQT